MFLNFGLIFNAVLLALGVYWCYEIFGRWREDLEELREVDDKIRKAVIIGFWIFTALVAAFVVIFTINLISTIVAGIRMLL